MSFCTQCGLEVHNAFCPRCGAPAHSAPQPSQFPPPPPAPRDFQPGRSSLANQPRRSRSARWPLIALVLTCLAVIIIWLGLKTPYPQRMPARIAESYLRAVAAGDL